MGGEKRSKKDFALWKPVAYLPTYLPSYLPTYLAA